VTEVVATDAASPRRARRWWILAVAPVIVVAVAVVAVVVALRHRPPPAVTLPLRPAGQIALPGDGSRFDYASLDADRGRPFLGCWSKSQLIQIFDNGDTSAAWPRAGSPKACSMVRSRV
jgi:hypothetical protein